MNQILAQILAGLTPLQMAIGVNGLIAIFLLTRTSERPRHWGAFVALIGQPFWIYETARHAQWGMFALSVGHTLIYLEKCKTIIQLLMSKKVLGQAERVL